MTLSNLNKSIIHCRKCARLVNFREKIAKEKRKQYIHQSYWGKPITGYGDEKAKLLMVGLAPAATRVKNEKTYAANVNNLVIILVSLKLSIYS